MCPSLLRYRSHLLGCQWTLPKVRYFSPSLFSLCFTTHITFSADHGDQRLRPIPSPADRRCPSRVRRYHPHTMGNDAYAGPPPPRRICHFCFLGVVVDAIVILIVIIICFSSFNDIDMSHIMLVDCCMLCCRECGPIAAV